MNFNYKNPITPLISLGNQSVPRTGIYGTNFSVLGTGGYMEVYSLSDLYYTIPIGDIGLIEYSANTIPIQFNKGTGSVFSPDVLTLNSDNISSGRRRIGMLVYVIDEDQIYQYQIPNFESLFSGATGATGPGGNTVVFSEFGTTIKSNSPEGVTFISAWTSNVIEGVSGGTSTNSVWKKLVTGGGSATGDYLPLSGGTVTGDTIFTSGLTATTFSAATYLGLPLDIFVTGGTYSAGTITFTNNSGGTFDVTGLFTGGTSSVDYLPLSGGTVTGDTIFTSGLTATTISATTIFNNDINIIDSLYYVESTGVISFTGLTRLSTTTFNVSSVHGYIVSNTDTTNIIKEINYSGVTGQTTPFLNTDVATYVLISSASTLVLQNTFPTPTQRRENIFLGRIAHPDKISIVTANNTTDFVFSPMSSIRDLFTPISLINQGIVISPNGANLSFNTSSGTLYGMGINFYNEKTNPDSVFINGNSPTTFQYRTQTGGTYSNTTTLEVNYYDNNGVRTLIPGNKSTNQRVYLFPSGQIRIQYGQTLYSNLTNAIAAVLTEPFITFSNNRDNAILIGIISVQSNATVLNNTSEAYFNSISKFGELLGGTGGLSTTTLQQAYNNSSTPEIITNSILDGFSIKNGTGNNDNITNNFESINSTGDTTAFIRADGLISAVTISTSGATLNNNGLTATTISASTYQNLPIDIRVTGGTYSNGTATFTNNTGGTFNVTGFYTGATDVFVTGGTKSGSVITFTNNTGGTFTVTGVTDTFVTGGTYNSGTNTITFTNNTGGTFTVTGITSGGGTFTGGTVTGDTNFTGGLTANTISASTYSNLPVSNFIEFNIVGNSAVISTLVTGTKISPSSITFTNWRIRGYANNDGTGSGSITITLTKNGVNMIGAGNAPTLSSAQSNNATISGWTSSSIVEGDIIICGVSSVTSLIGCTLILY